MSGDLLASLYVFFVLLGVVVAILWVLLPFAVFGLKGRIDELIKIEKLQLENLRALRRKLVPESEAGPGGAPLSDEALHRVLKGHDDEARRDQA